MSDLPGNFYKGQSVRAAEFNSIRARLLEEAEKSKVAIEPIERFEDGQILDSKRVNALADGVFRLANHRGLKWSFSPLKDGDVLHPEPFRTFKRNSGAIAKTFLRNWAAGGAASPELGKAGDGCPRRI